MSAGECEVNVLPAVSVKAIAVVLVAAADQSSWECCMKFREVNSRVFFGVFVAQLMF